MAGAPGWAGAWTTPGPGWARAPGPGTRASASTEVVRSQGVPRRGPVTGSLLRRIAGAHVACRSRGARRSMMTLPQPHVLGHRAGGWTRPDRHFVDARPGPPPTHARVAMSTGRARRRR